MIRLWILLSWVYFLPSLTRFEVTIHQFDIVYHVEYHSLNHRDHITLLARLFDLNISDPQRCIHHQLFTNQFYLSTYKLISDETIFRDFACFGISITNSRQEIIIEHFKVFYYSFSTFLYFNFLVGQGVPKHFVPMIVWTNVILNAKKIIWNWFTILMLLDTDLSVNISIIDLLLIKSKENKFEIVTFITKMIAVFQSLPGRAMWKCIEDLSYCTIFPEDYVF